MALGDGVGGWGGYGAHGAHEAHLKLLADMEKQEEAAKPVLRELENDLAKAKESQEACAPQQQSEGSIAIRDSLLGEVSHGSASNLNSWKLRQ